MIEEFINSSSSLIAKFRYDEDESTLYVVFRSNNKQYAYAEVTHEEFLDMRAAPSHGKWFNENIRGIKPVTEV